MHKEGIVSVTGETWILQNSQKVKETSTPGVPILDFTSFSLSIALIVMAVVGGKPLLWFPSLKVDSVLHCVQMSPILLKKSSTIPFPPFSSSFSPCFLLLKAPPSSFMLFILFLYLLLSPSLFLPPLFSSLHICFLFS